jgi:tetratricopeptide (TPR) repeat protein
MSSFSLVVLAGVAVLGSALAARGPAGVTQSPGDRVNATIDEAFTAAYNLDIPEALATARRAVTLGPDRSAPHRALAAIIWLEILLRRGTVTIDHYLGGSVTRSQMNLPKPPADLDAEFKRELALAIDLAEKRLAAQPEDIQARFDVGSAYALQASYTASVEGSMTAAFKSARRAYDAQEAVMLRDPRRADAGVVVGTYRYVVSALGLPTRVLAYMVGFGGGKERGISLLEAAARHPDTRVDARTALMLIYSREGRHAEVERIARELAAEFPRNRLFMLEEGSAAIRAGHADVAEAALTRGLAFLEKDSRPKMPGERALWLYKRGKARLNQNHLKDALVDLNQALTASPVGWVRGRIHLELGRIADLAGKRAEAMNAYQTAKTVCETSNDPACISEANRLLRQPFSFDRAGKQ